MAVTTLTMTSMKMVMDDDVEYRHGNLDNIVCLSFAFFVVLLLNESNALDGLVAFKLNENHGNSKSRNQIHSFTPAESH